jgi:hypothetical protein
MRARSRSGVQVKPRVRDPWKAGVDQILGVFVLRLLKDDTENTKISEDSKKWSPRATLLFTIITCGIFWGLVAYWVL